MRVGGGGGTGVRVGGGGGTGVRVGGGGGTGVRVGGGGGTGVRVGGGAICFFFLFKKCVFHFSQAVLTNLLLRNYLHYNLYDQVNNKLVCTTGLTRIFHSYTYSICNSAPSSHLQADKLVSKSVFPESANNNEIARHHYYLGEWPRPLIVCGLSY